MVSEPPNSGTALKSLTHFKSMEIPKMSISTAILFRFLLGTVIAAFLARHGLRKKSLAPSVVSIDIFTLLRSRPCTISPTVRIWAFQARDPGSTPGWCTYFLPQLSVSFCLCMDFCQESISTIRSVSLIASWLNFMIIFIILAYKLRNLPLLFRRDLGYSIPGMSPFTNPQKKNYIST